jgi:hypothetical protein
MTTGNVLIEPIAEGYLGKRNNRVVLAIILQFIGYAKIGDNNGLEYYAFRCKKHGLVVDYPHGHDEFLICLRCNSN